MRAMAALALAALGLSGVVGLELNGSLAPVPMQAGGDTAAGPRRAAVTDPDASAGWQATLLQRPLFSPSRRPPPSAGAAGIVGLPRLAGVLVAPGDRHAIFAGGIVVAEGGAVGRYTVQAIDAGQVTLRGPEGTQVLRPAFASVSTAAQAAAVPGAAQRRGQPGAPTPPALRGPK